ncbi:MAG: AIR synthase-related protein, partial [Syntrophorhabdus sp.]
ADVSRYLSDIFFDPQTSGGLLVAVPGEKAIKMVKRLKEKGIDEAAIIGEIIDEPKERIIVRLAAKK